MRRPILFASILSASLPLAACEGEGAMGGMNQPRGPTPVEEVSLGATLENPALSAPVDLVRDEWGIPHIYGWNIADVAFAQGYVMAQDRMVLMDLARHQADGTLTELVGELSPTVIDGDIAMRAHHLR